MKDLVMCAMHALARNYQDIPFDTTINEEYARRIRTRVEDVLQNRVYSYAVATNEGELQNTVDNTVFLHLMDIDNALGRSPQFYYRMDENEIIQVNGFNHLSLFHYSDSANMTGCRQSGEETERILKQGYEYARDESLGYLTAAPCNAGLAVRMCWLLHLPALTLSGSMLNLNAEMLRSGLLLHPYAMTGMNADGALFVMENRTSAFWPTEDEMVRASTQALKRITILELNRRTSMKNGISVQQEDRIMRSVGLGCYARKLSEGELLNVWSDCMTANLLGLTQFSEYSLDMLWNLYEKQNGRDAKDSDIARAEKVRTVLNGR